jgi:hypothetical protein
MNASDDRAERSGGGAAPAPLTGCRERQDLLTRLTQAFDDYSDAVRKSRERGSVAQDQRTEVAGARCAQAWTELREHQEKHGCGP